MRLRSFSFAAAAMAALAASFLATPALRAQATDPLADGLMPSDYIRGSAGLVAPLSGMRYWKSGVGANLMWENWQQGASGVGRVGFGLGIGYTWLPFNASDFVQNFRPATPGISVTSAAADKATILEISSLIRIRIPAPYIMPTVNIGLGFLNWAPGKIDYTTTGAAGTATSNATQQHRSGAEVSIGAGLDKNLFDRYAIFGEGIWSYGFTSFASGFATPNSSCAGGCDNERNTSFGTVRGGLRVRLGR